jgi:quinol monooxygenase YgiN
LNNPNKLRITEKWLSLEALKAHMATPHMAEFQAAMGAHPPASLEVTFYEVTEIQPF